MRKRRRAAKGRQTGFPAMIRADQIAQESKQDRVAPTSHLDHDAAARASWLLGMQQRSGNRATASLAGTLLSRRAQSQRASDRASGPPGDPGLQRWLGLDDFVEWFVDDSKFSVGDRISTTSNLRVRDKPGMSGTRILGVAPRGHDGKILDGPRAAGSYQWWKVEFDGGLEGWSAQPGLAANDQATEPRSPASPGTRASDRPSSGAMASAYGKVDYGNSADEFLDNTDPKIRKTFRSRGWRNTCAARLTVALIDAGHGIQSGGWLDSQGRRWMASARATRASLKRMWGPPDDTLTTDKEVDQAIDNLESGQVAVFAGQGHVGILKQGYQDPYVRAYVPVDVWILPE